jgi:uncharacterized membrane protein YgcG
MAVMMGLGVLPWIASAAEETVAIPITPAPAGGVGVYFADNMVFTPQWRTGNYVRIEMMIIDMTDLVDDNLDGILDPLDIRTADIDMYDQATILANPALVLNTRMVSLPSIQVQVVSPEGAVVWDAYTAWNADGSLAETNNLIGREVNKAGHLIYGGQWDTTGAAEGVYTVYVALPDGYNVMFAMGTYKIGLETLYDPAHPYIELADSEDDPQYVEYDIGIGDVTADGEAMLILGQMIGRGAGGGSGNGGGNGGSDGGHHGSGGGGGGGGHGHGGTRVSGR